MKALRGKSPVVSPVELSLKQKRLRDIKEAAQGAGFEALKKGVGTEGAMKHRRQFQKAMTSVQMPLSKAEEESLSKYKGEQARKAAEKESRQKAFNIARLSK